MRYIYIFFSILVWEACAQNVKELEADSVSEIAVVDNELMIINPLGKTIATRFNTPLGFQREQSDSTSYAFYLRHLPLKKHGSLVLYYDGTVKDNFNVYDAVVDLEIGKRDLHQCADAIMRLRAEYLWNQKQYTNIHFNFTNGFRVEYSEWMKGRRMVVKGNKTYWNTRNSPSNTYQDFWNYMELIFNYAGTLSLSKELKSIPISELQIGDIFIKGGSPGHAVTVVDVAKNKEGQKLFLLAQSYMPAQEVQILKNPNNSNSPWYAVENCKSGLETPEWGFREGSLKRFK
tara:strand:+ start:23894 stop:24760 length:867 start_codon:yes stop_codon:yes gene_type:complete